MSRSNRLIIGGVDTHAATHHAAVIDLHGRLLADAQFSATPRGYASLLTWMRGKGRVDRVGIEAPGPHHPPGAAAATRPGPRGRHPRLEGRGLVVLTVAGLVRIKPSAWSRAGLTEPNRHKLLIAGVRFTFVSATSRSTIDQRSPRDAAATAMIPKGDRCARGLSGLSAETVQATCPTAVPIA
jgi:hypothetical protein